MVRTWRLEASIEEDIEGGRGHVKYFLLVSLVTTDNLTSLVVFWPGLLCNVMFKNMTLCRVTWHTQNILCQCNHKEHDKQATSTSRTLNFFIHTQRKGCTLIICTQQRSSSSSSSKSCVSYKDMLTTYLSIQNVPLKYSTE
jgi:hypothetical protein